MEVMKAERHQCIKNFLQKKVKNIFVGKFFQDCNLHIKDVMASLVEMTSIRFAKISPLNIALVFGKNVNFKNTRS